MTASATLARLRPGETNKPTARDVAIGPLCLRASIHMPQAASALVVFAYCDGDNHLGGRNLAVVEALNRHGIAALLLDLRRSGEKQDHDPLYIPCLAQRLVEVVHWIDEQRDLACFPLGLFGTGISAVAALLSASLLDTRIGAAVFHGSQAHLAQAVLDAVKAPTLMITGGLEGQTSDSRGPASAPDRRTLAARWLRHRLTISRRKAA